MKIEEPLLGFAEYGKKTYPFLYQDGILNLMPATIEDWRGERSNVVKKIMNHKSSIQTQEWIGYTYIKAYAHTGREVIFYVTKDSSNNNGFISYIVLYLFVYDKEKIDEEHIAGLCLNGNEIDYFYDPARAFETQITFVEEKMHKTSITTGMAENESVGTYSYKDTKIDIILRVVPTIHTRAQVPISAKSEMLFVFSEPRNIDFVFDILEHCNKFFFYICRRSNIKFCDVHTFSVAGTRRSMDGILRIVENTEEETNLKKTEKIIKYEFLKNNVAGLFNAISSGNMYFEHIQPSIEATNTYSIERIILNFVAFEREFRNLYTEEIERSEEYYEIKDDIIRCLEELKQVNKGKKKKYVKGFLASIQKSENKFADRMRKSLRDCEEILKPFLIYDYGKEEDELIECISERMNTMRNDSAHGNIDLNIEPINMSDFATIENLLYVMRLKSLGIGTIDIRKAIRAVRGYNMMVSETE